MQHFEHIADYHRQFHLPQPKHPLVDTYKYEDTNQTVKRSTDPHTTGFYRLSLKWGGEGTILYGRTEYDYNDGIWLFFAPNQLMALSGVMNWTGYAILVHPQFFESHPLAQRIRQYPFFGYAVHEALHVSEREKQTLIDLFEKFYDEYHNREAIFSADILISYIELMLRYADRYYQRQFETREVVSNHTLQRFEHLMNDFFAKRQYQELGQPKVEYFAQALNLSPSYLSDLIKTYTGKTTLTHIHDRLIEEAKLLLSQNRTVSEVAYDLGFEYPQYFSRFFKNKTNYSPTDFQKSGKGVSGFTG
ncbi:MAG: helix-turn-helix domain-containing protein [Saprospiraceae bacterium]